MRGRTIAAGAAALVFMFTAVACEDDDDPTGPTTGAVEVQVATTGTGTDADGYTVSVDGGTDVAVAVDGTVVVSGVATGTRSVMLGGIDAACAVQGDNPVSVTVAAGDTVAASFDVQCTAPVTGTIMVTTATTGESIDPDGYMVDSNGDTLAIQVDDTVYFEEFAPGDYDVTLSGVEANCTVADTTTQMATLAGDDTAAVDFAITCAAPSTSQTSGSAGSVLTMAPSNQLDRLLSRAGS